MPWARSETLRAPSETPGPKLMLWEWLPAQNVPLPQTPRDGSSCRSGATLVLLGSLPGMGGMRRGSVKLEGGLFFAFSRSEGEPS